jgi:hypothetical protein
MILQIFTSRVAGIIGMYYHPKPKVITLEGRESDLVKMLQFWHMSKENGNPPLGCCQDHQEKEAQEGSWTERLILFLCRAQLARVGWSVRLGQKLGSTAQAGPGEDRTF